MHVHHRNDHVPGHSVPHMKNNRNYLGIKKIDRIYDNNSHQLVLLVSTKDMLGKEVNAILKGSNLILEAPYEMETNRPLRTHLIGREFLRDYENEVSVIGFSEIKLKPGYHYQVLSCQLINPNLVKILLQSKFSFNHS